MTLDHQPLGTLRTVHGVVAPPGHTGLAQQLEDLGFTAGEPVSVRRRAAFGGDPLVVRVGDSTYALRRAEAACVRLVPEMRR